MQKVKIFDNHVCSIHHSLLYYIATIIETLFDGRCIYKKDIHKSPLILEYLTCFASDTKVIHFGFFLYT